LDFTFDDYETEPEKNEVVHTIKLKNQNGITFYDKLTFIYLEMPNYKLSENQLKTRLDKWLYFIKNLEDFQSIPTIISDDVFNQAFEKAELAKFGQEELYSYEMNLKIYRDYKNTMDTAFDQGKLEGKIETAKSLKSLGVSIETIMVATGLRKEELDRI
jgi:predicted transposase/invertase (TIGR01784 family)